jgi:hypothetical protein
MCNDYANHIPYDAYLRAFSDLRIKIFPTGGAIPNLEPPTRRHLADRHGADHPGGGGRR